MQPHELVPPIGDNEILRLPLLWARGKYKFADDGGAVGDINLLASAEIPNNALVLPKLAIIRVITVPTSGGAATIAVKVEGAADINAADAISGAPWSTTGFKEADATAPIRTTAARNIAITVGTAALTAGELDVFIPYLVGI